MSWSENLVEYMDESIRHEPPTVATGSTAGMTKPIKSAMTRSASMRSHPLSSGLSSTGSTEESKERKIRYLPNGLDRAHNGLIMPTRPVGMGAGMGMGVGSETHGNGGIESPQWGWYINTTPPTPEMYQSRSRYSEKSDQSTASAASSLDNGMTYDNPAAAAARGPNKIFQGLKAGSNRPPVGWPSVPL